MKIQSKSVESLVPYLLNNRKHGEKQVDRIASSIKEFGFNQPLVIDKDNVVIVGHGRLEAAKKLGLTDVPTVCVGELTDAQKKAYRILDNKLQNDSEWDVENLALEFGVLDDLGFDLSFGGLEELKDLFGEDDAGVEVVEDDFEPDEEEDPYINKGDLIELGKHRVLCGDSTDAAKVELLMAGQKAGVCFTSPPYNANTTAGDGDVFNGKKSKKLYGRQYADDLSSSDYISFTRAALSLCFKHTDGFIFWNVSYNANARYEYIEQIIPWLEYLIEQVCWKKHSAIPIKGSMRRAWEPIYIFSTGKRSLGLSDVESNYWDISNTGCQADGHKACFPVALPAKGIALISDAKIVYEPFCGSGTTLIAAEQLGRKCYGMEISPKYCQVIIQRYRKYCEDNNKPFECKVNGEEIEQRWATLPENI